MICFVVPGLPVGQGSKRHVGNGVMVESAANLKPWREAIIYAAREHCAQMVFPDGPVNVELIFYFPRPKSHYGTGRNATALKDSAPFYKATKPDIDKLVRAALDGITQSGRIWRDDAQVSGLLASKEFRDTGSLDVRVWGAG